MADLPVVDLRGSSAERGRQHGRALRRQIEQAVEFYAGLFGRLGLTGAEVRRRAARFVEPTHRLNPLLAAEFEGIAEGSRCHLHDVYALSARYEIAFTEVALGECSNVFVGAERSTTGATLLGQNWDWRPEVAAFRVILRSLCDDGPDHVMISECGQPGKFGLNSAGLGLVAAGLDCTARHATGDQLYVGLKRTALQCESIEEAGAVLAGNPPLATVNVIAAQAAGAGCEIEYTPAGPVRRDLAPAELYWHTNHCREADEPSGFENSLRRGRRWSELTGGTGDVAPRTLESWLADREGDDRICQTPRPGDTRITSLETLSSLVLDLRSRTLWATAGPSHQAPYRPYRLP